MMSQKTPIVDEKCIVQRLKTAGLRPTRQRVVIGQLLLDGRKRHIVAEQLYDEVQATGRNIALATVYNCLHKFTDAGLLRQINNSGEAVLFDTNLTAHYHFLEVETGKMKDIDPSDVNLKIKYPVIPEGFEAESIELTVRLRRSIR